MSVVLGILTALALAGVLGVLFTGMIGVARNQDARRSNRLMQWRVILQAAALVLFILLLYSLKS